MFRHFEHFSVDDQARIVGRLQGGSLSNDTIDLITEYLKYYKTDYLVKKTTIMDKKSEVSYRAGGIASIEVMIALFNGLKKAEHFTDRMTGKTKQTGKPIENDA